MLTVLLKYTDLTNLRVGIPTEDGFLSLTVDYLAKQTGMVLRCAEHALADLKAAGLVTVAQPRKRLPGGPWKGLAAVTSPEIAFSERRYEERYAKIRNY